MHIGAGHTIRAKMADFDFLACQGRMFDIDRGIDNADIEARYAPTKFGSPANDIAAEAMIYPAWNG